jgi:transposase-like protein
MRTTATKPLTPILLYDCCHKEDCVVELHQIVGARAKVSYLVLCASVVIYTEKWKNIAGVEKCRKILHIRHLRPHRVVDKEGFEVHPRAKRGKIGVIGQKFIVARQSEESFGVKSA